MQIRLYFDADAQKSQLVRSLRVRGVDVVIANEARMSDCSDPDQLAYATAHGRVLYSFNMRDYNALHTACLIQGTSHAGIILAPQQRYSVGEQMRRLLKIINTKSAEQMHNSIEFLSAWG